MIEKGYDMTRTFITKELGSDLMVYDPEQEEVHILNASARLIHSLYKEGRDLDEIEQVIHETFDVEHQHDIAALVRVCLAELEGKGLISPKER